MSRSFKDPNESSPNSPTGDGGAGGSGLGGYYAVGISLGAQNTVVAVSSKQSQRIDVVANASGSRTTPACVAFCEHGGGAKPAVPGQKPPSGVLFGNDAKQLYPRQPAMVIPSIFSYAAASSIAGKRAASATGQAAEGEMPEQLSQLDRSVRAQYKGSCPLEVWVKESHAGDGAHTAPHKHHTLFGFVDPHLVPEEEEEDQSAESTEEARREKVNRAAFVDAEDLFVEYLNHIKESTIDSACQLTSAGGETGEDANAGAAKKERCIFLTVSVPRHLFLSEGAFTTSGFLDPFFDEQDVLDWVYDSVTSSALGGCVASVEVLFSDVCAVLGADAFKTIADNANGGSSAPSYDSATSSFLSVPPTVLWAQQTSESQRAASSPYYSGAVLVIDWGAHGLSMSICNTCNGVLSLCSSNSAVAKACGGDLLFHRPSSAVFSKGGSAKGAGGVLAGGCAAVDTFLAEHITEAFIKRYGRSLGVKESSDIGARSRRKLHLLAEEKKITLSAATQTGVEVEAFHEGVDLNEPQLLSRLRMDNWLRQDMLLLDGFNKALEVILERFERSLESRGYDLKKAPQSVRIGGVIFAGGMCRIPLIANHLKALFSAIPTQPSAQSALSRFSHCFQASGNAESTAETISVPLLSSTGAVSSDELFAVGACLESVTSLLQSADGIAKDNERKRRLAGKSQAKSSQPASVGGSPNTAGSGKKGGKKKSKKKGGKGGKNKGGRDENENEEEEDEFVDARAVPGVTSESTFKRGILPKFVYTYVADRACAPNQDGSTSPVSANPGGIGSVPPPVDDAVCFRRLRTPIYIFVGSDAEARKLAESSKDAEASIVSVDRSRLACVFERHTSLPSEVTIDAGEVSAGKKVLVYLFAEAATSEDAPASETEKTCTVLPLTREPLAVKCGASGVPCFLRLTLGTDRAPSSETRADEDGDAQAIAAATESASVVTVEAACINSTGRVIAQPVKVPLEKL